MNTITIIFISFLLLKLRNYCLNDFIFNLISVFINSNLLRKSLIGFGFLDVDSSDSSSFALWILPGIFKTDRLISQ